MIKRRSVFHNFKLAIELHCVRRVDGLVDRAGRGFFQSPVVVLSCDAMRCVPEIKADPKLIALQHTFQTSAMAFAWR